MQCPNCGAENQAANKFCGECGTALPRACAKCGIENPPGNEFCGQCGNNLSTPAAPSAKAPSAKAPSAAAAEPEAERRHLTVMFCDLVGSTALSERLDPEDLREVLGEYQDACGRQIKAFGGYIARYMGDGILIYFGYPHAHEDDPERAVRAGLEIIDAVGRLRPDPDLNLRVRLGVATGLVVAGDIIGEGASEEHAVLGVTPNLAARLQGIAEPNDLIVGEDTRKLAGGFFDFEDLGSHRLKGISDPVQAWRVIGESTVLSRFEATTALGMTPLVGRDEEIALLMNRWKQANDGDGQVVMLQGEAGVGKSRIIRGFRDGLEDGTYGAIVLSCSPFHTNSALHPVSVCLERYLGLGKDDTAEDRADKLEGFLDDLGLPSAKLAPVMATLLIDPAESRYPPPEGKPELRKRMITEALLDMLQALAERQPMFMIAEDVHWIDPSSEEFLSLAIDRLRPLRLLLLITSRPEYRSAWTGHPQVTTLMMNRLSRADSAAMVAELTGGRELPREVLDQILTKTDGVPLFVEELTKTVLESGLVAEAEGRYVLSGPLTPFAIPASLHDSLMARLDRLAAVKEVAQLAAVLGRVFGEDQLAAVSPLGAEGLGAALDELVDKELIFRRSLPPDASYEFKHALVQDTAYESLLKSTRQRYHLDIARVLESDFPAVVEAEPEVIAHHYSEAGTADQAVPYWRQAGTRATERFASTETVAHLNRGLEVLATLPDDAGRSELEVALSIDLVIALRILDRYDDALAVLEGAEAAARGHDRTEDLSHIHYYRGNIYFPMGNINGCLEQHQLARDYARKAASPKSEARALSGLGDAYYMRGMMITANRHFDECVTLCRDNDFMAIEAANLAMRGHTRMYMNDLEGGLVDSLAAAEIAAKASNTRAELIARGNCAGKILFDMADLEQARVQCERSIELAKRLGARRFEPISLVILGKIQALDGDIPAAVALAEQAVAISRETGFSFAGPMALGTLALVTDDAETRRAALDEGEETLRDDCVSHNYLWFFRDAIDACLDSGDWDRVHRLAAAAEAYTRPEPLPWMDLLIARGRALADFGHGKRDKETIAELGRLRAESDRIHLHAAIPALDEALAAAG